MQENEVDWNEIAKLDNINIAEFELEFYNDIIHYFWNIIISDSNVQNNEALSIWLQTMSHNHWLKLKFINWLSVIRSGDKQENNGPIRIEEIMTFLTSSKYYNEFRLGHTISSRVSVPV